MKMDMTDPMWGALFFTRGNGLISKRIRSHSRSRGEKKTLVNHVGTVIASGNGPSSFKGYEAWHNGTRFTDIFLDHAGRQIFILRPKRYEITRGLYGRIMATQGQKYGWHRILAHMVDSYLSKARRKEVALFRRWWNGTSRPICSQLIVELYPYYDWGVEGWRAQPDHLLDICEERPMDWEWVDSPWT